MSHILLDYTTAYGIRMFAPFDWRWYSWDIVFIIEPIILLALITGLVLPSLFGLINQEIGARSKGPRGRAGAIFALVCLVLIWGVRDYQHRRALNAMGALLYQGAVPVKMGAYPYWVNPFRWHGVVETENVFPDGAGEFDDTGGGPAGEAHTYFKPEVTPATQAAKASYFGRVYLDWAVFPLTQTEQLQGAFKGYLVRFQDLRFEYPETRGRGNLADGCWWVLTCGCRRKVRTRGNRRLRTTRRRLDGCHRGQVSFPEQIIALDAAACGVQNQKTLCFRRAHFLR